MTALGARLVCITPETPDNSLSTREKNGLTFDVLHDPGNLTAQTYGLVFTLNNELRDIYLKLGIDLSAQNGDGSWSLPVPGTYVIGRDGIVAYHFADADYTKRLDPEQVVKTLKELS